MLNVSVGDLKNLFPTKVHFMIFIGYMTLFINQGLLITASKDKNGHYNYNTTTVVMFTETVKLLVACVLQLRESTVPELFGLIREHVKVLVLYMIPAFLYCLYNNLAFVNLSAYDPTTYFLLLQFRVVVTGVIFQILFSKQLSRVQWVSLLLLTAGCIIKQLKFGSESAGLSLKLDQNLVLIMVQVFCSCFAGVYNEYLLKGRSGEAPLMIQNVFMYIDSILCNLLLLTYRGTLQEAFTSQSINSILTVNVVSIIFNNAAIGIVTSLFLKKLNSILKTFASALELMFTAVLSWIIFGIPITVLTIIALIIVTYAIILYSQNPVDNTQKPTSEGQKVHSDKENQAMDQKV
ncbi:UDP-galactose transporter senju [Exaiptasia diaphana]|uniref:CMP-sialic acid transporter n=1 Tax=Exaiptasia diaphana TaxID=2652724 RepID=A0A913WVX4_EXADI|nr:UDP-galactose transporter senju [Exaiptasia diaphana]KXJ17474.1 CMP-sialic acid transporter 1 [Exaiptasia diaphana]